MRRRFTRAGRPQLHQEAGRKVDKGCPLGAISAKGAVLELNAPNALHLLDGRNEGDVPEQTVVSSLLSPQSSIPLHIEYSGTHASLAHGNSPFTQNLPIDINKYTRIVPVIKIFLSKTNRV